MAHPALSRDEAALRAAAVRVIAYDVDLDLSSPGSTFRSTSRVRFQAIGAPGILWIDIVAAQLHSVMLNGQPVTTEGYNGQRLTLPALATGDGGLNELVVDAECIYSRTGEGLHRLVDPVDNEVYLYSQFETADAQRVYACFDQPDLKARFTFHLTAPAHWQVVSNAPTPAAMPVRDGVARWEFAETAVMSTYITAIVAGPYHVVRDEYVGAHGRYPLGVFCRRSMAEYLDADAILLETKQGFEFFERVFGHPYPFGKYDQLFVPEYNAGAMENAGAVTIMEDYIFRSRVTDAAYEQRANTILHELAHMWFGDLVTMTWWDDLWLNESFAEWASHHAMIHATRYTEAWTTFLNLRKAWAYRQDQLPSTHPIATDMHDLEAVKLNFDGITYAKGASALRQLVAWVGEEHFFQGLRAYFDKHKWGNTTLADLLRELERTSGRSLGEWTRQWLQTAGVNLLRPTVQVDAEGRYSQVRITQEPPSTPSGLAPELRSHRIRVGLYRLDQGALRRTEQVELDVVGAMVEVPELVGLPAADLLLLNDDDLTFAKIRLDERSLATALEHLGKLTDSLARTLIWGAAWDMTRDAEMSAGDFLALALAGLPTEGDIGVVSQVLRQARGAVEAYSAPQHLDQHRRRLAEHVHGALLAAEPGSDHQLAYARALATCGQPGPDLDLLAALLDGQVVLPGLKVDTDLRWTLLARLAALGRADQPQIDAELLRDNTSSGRRQAMAVRAALPTAAAKAEAWDSAITDETLPNSLLEAALGGLQLPEQRDLLRPYREQYFEVVELVWAARSQEMAAMIATALYPGLILEPQTVQMTNDFLASRQLPAGLRRIITEGRDAVERALRCQTRDAAAPQ